MSPSALLASLYQLGITLEADGDTLHCSAPKGVITPAIQSEILQHKKEFLNLLHAAQMYRNKTTVSLAFNLQQEVEREEVIFAELSGGVYSLYPEKILLTGATGFLGTFLLNELLERTAAKIYCLIRAHDHDEARERLRSAFLAYGMNCAQLDTRVVPVPGDLAQPSWGLTERHFQTLAEEIDVIYHNGAFMNLIYPYSLLKAINVLGTQQIIRLALQTRIKPLHYISTVSVLAPPATTMGRINEQTPTDDFYKNLTIGYSQTKWVAETLVARARERGLPATIYRPGLISGHSRIGVCNTKDYLCRIIKGCLQLGYMPTTSEPVSFTPVDYVSKAIVNLSRKRAAQGKVFHLVNPHGATGKEIIDWIHTLGYPLQEVSYEEWGRVLIENTQRSTENALYPLLQIFLSTDPSSSQINAFSANLARCDCQQTLEELKDTDIICPPTDFQLLNTYFKYFQHTGFLDLPDTFAAMTN